MEELTKPIEELSLREVNLHRGQIVTLLTDRAGDVTGLVRYALHPERQGAGTRPQGVLT